VKQVQKGTVTAGMSRDQVLMALGYPPGDQTPSLDAPAWTYFASPGETLVVYFDGNRVQQVQRQAATSGRRSRRKSN
jgi:outer membrane protein assembly factor BamE (lipoprotein component of BamABCDE complex)